MAEADLGRVTRAGQQTAGDEAPAGAVLAVDVLGQLIYVNAMLESVTGLSRQDLLGQSLIRVFARIPLGGTQCVAALTRRAMDENRPVSAIGDWLLSHHEVRPVEIEVRAAPIHDRGGTVAGAVIVFCGIVMALD